MFFKRVFSRAYTRILFFNQNIACNKGLPKSYFTMPILYCFSFVNYLPLANLEPLKNVYSKQEEIYKNNETINSAMKQSDDLFLIGKFKESYTILLQYKDTDNVEILWRICRALYNMAKQKGTNKFESVSFIDEAILYIHEALKLDDEHYAVHKWMAILVDAQSSLESIKSRINTLPIFKKHLMRAIELNPKDATSIYMLGQYMYNIADMSWLQLSIAKALFGTLPEASFEEAFYYFSKAEELEPNFYSANLLMLGKTALKLKRIETAHYWLKCATSYPVRTDEDEKVRLEAEDLLKKYSLKKK